MLAFGYHGVQQKNKRFEHDSGLPPAASSGSKRWKVALSAKCGVSPLTTRFPKTPR
jgi:hypothetical protein